MFERSGSTSESNKWAKAVLTRSRNRLELGPEVRARLRLEGKRFNHSDASC